MSANRYTRKRGKAKVAQPRGSNTKLRRVQEIVIISPLDDSSTSSTTISVQRAWLVCCDKKQTTQLVFTTETQLAETRSVVLTNLPRWRSHRRRSAAGSLSLGSNAARSCWPARSDCQRPHCHWKTSRRLEELSRLCVGQKVAFQVSVHASRPSY